jgi:hypothetical protein
MLPPWFVYCVSIGVVGIGYASVYRFVLRDELKNYFVLE